MESAAAPAPPPAEATSGVEDKGLKKNAIGFVSSVVIGVELVPKRASEALIAAAEEPDARMIVVGSGGQGALKGFILGTTPHKLLHLSERPVLVVHADG